MENRYYELPRFVFEDEKFKTLSHSARLLYAINLDDEAKINRFHNNNPDTKHFIDEQGKSYIAPKREKLAKLLNCSIDTITRLKKQLVNHGLLKEVRTGCNKPNRLYPIMPQDVKGNGYIKIPQLLFTDKYYKSISPIAIIVYSCLDDRFNMSIENDYKDREGNVFCKYSYNTLTEYVGCSRYAIKKAKDELIALGLMNETQDTHVSSMKYYMSKPYVRRNEEAEQESKTEETHSGKTLDNSGNDKIEPLDNAKLNRTDNAKLNSNYPTHNYPIYNYPRTNDKSDKYEESTSKREQADLQITHSTNQNQFDNSQSIQEKDRYLQQYPGNLANALRPYDLESIQNYMSIICNTKNQYNLEMGRDFTLEDMDMELARTVDQVKRTMKKNGETPKAMFGYFKVSVIDCVAEYDITISVEELRDLFDFNEQELAESEANMRRRKEERLRYLKNLKKQKVVA
ncbi:replication initiator protein A [Staphylococcus capitis]|uniref:Replication initiator A N-terminal domain-containing protein n=1 Tax=Staphylococcus capitis TaxID=29388 RepID=A0ABX1SNX0_STACP|nr:replication initiator protein A [Staphylococcus capitis]NMK54004.1 hypothetical protein [Staphylococcus capitis]NMK69303.1 hypothetical protein [Staphylococcus capitis]